MGSRNCHQLHKMTFAGQVSIVALAWISAGCSFSNWEKRKISWCYSEITSSININLSHPTESAKSASNQSDWSLWMQERNNLSTVVSDLTIYIELLCLCLVNGFIVNCCLQQSYTSWCGSHACNICQWLVEGIPERPLRSKQICGYRDLKILEAALVMLELFTQLSFRCSSAWPMQTFLWDKVTPK